jgi:hypothetical protein
MSACEGAITTINCVKTESAAHGESANAEFEAAASQLEELGCSYELSNGGFTFHASPSWESTLHPPGPPLLLSWD